MRSPITNWDDTTELPAIVTGRCLRCGAHDWGPHDEDNFHCMTCVTGREHA